jgi:hypothetical protein
VSSFDIEQINCSDLSNEVYQLAILLHTPEVINEKFMIKMRDCVVKLNDSHPVKRWMKWVATSKPMSAKAQTKRTFLLGIINSPFNLMTDLKIKNEIINLLPGVPENTLAEQILKAYLYLMIGNITRSDNILRQIVATPPRVNWEKSGLRPSIFHKLADAEMAQIFKKLSKHPADRRAFELLCLYIQNFYNDERLLSIANDVDSSDVSNKLNLKFVEGLAPHFIHYLRISKMSEVKKFKHLRNLKRYPLDMQSYWIWAFTDIDPLVSDVMYPELQRLETQDQLWFIYLLDNEKLADLFSRKKGKSFLPGRRPYLKEALNEPQTFMMSLYKLIELGDINHDLVNKAANQITHE